MGLVGKRPYTDKMHVTDLPSDVVRMIASKLIDRRPLVEAVRTYSAVSMAGRSMAVFRDTMAERLSAGHLLMHPCSRADIAVPPRPHPFPDGMQSVTVACIRDRLRKLGLKVSGAKAQIFARVCDHLSSLPDVPAVRPNVVPSSLRAALTCGPTARITVSEAKSVYRLTEAHLVGLDEQLKTNPVRRSGHPMRLYLKREVILAQFEKDDAKLRDKAARARDRAINGPRPRPPPMPKTPQQLARAARKARRAELTGRLDAHGLELRADSRMCREYVEYGGDVDAVVEMMVEMEFFVNLTEYSDIFSNIVEHIERPGRGFHDRDMRPYWDRDEVSHDAKRAALYRFVKAGGEIGDVPPHLQAEALEG